LGARAVPRRPHFLLTHPYGLDEGWVPVPARPPLSQLPQVNASTPIGWALLLRLVPPWGGREHLRLLPLAFSVAAVPVALLLGWQLRGRWQAAPGAGGGG